MRALRGILVLAIAVAAFLTGRHSRVAVLARGNDRIRSLGEGFRVIALHSNDVTGVAIVEGKAETPLWTEWNPEGKGGPHVVSYFFRGTNVLNLHLAPGERPRYDVIFYGPGQSQVWWWDKGGGSFSERISYDEHGDLARHEVWYDGVWHLVERRGGKNGIVVNGQWRHLRLSTNGVWTTEEGGEPANEHRQHGQG
jgi:hypothetical protein